MLCFLILALRKTLGLGLGLEVAIFHVFISAASLGLSDDYFWLVFIFYLNIPLLLLDIHHTSLTSLTVINNFTMRFYSVISTLTFASAVAFAPSSPLLSSSRSSALFTVDTTTTGKVKWFNAERRFGFIVQEDGTDVYVHDTGLSFQGTLVDDEPVRFEIEMDPKTNKNKAVNVARISGDAPPAVEEE